MPPFGLAYALAHQRAVEAAAKVASAKAANATLGSAWTSGVSSVLAPVAATVLQYVETDGGLSNAAYGGSVVAVALAAGAMATVVLTRKGNKAVSAKDRQLREVQDEVAEKQRRLGELQEEVDELLGESARGRRTLHESEMRGNCLQERSDRLQAQLARCEEAASRAVEEQRRTRMELERVPVGLVRAERETLQMREALAKKEKEMREALARARMELREKDGWHQAKIEALSRLLRQNEKTIEEDRVKMADFVDNIARQQETSDALSRQIADLEVSNGALIRNLRAVCTDSTTCEGMKEQLAKQEEETREALARAALEASEKDRWHQARMGDLSRLLRQSKTTIEEDRVKMADLADKIARQRESSDGLSRQIANLEARNATFICDLRSVRAGSAAFEAEAARHALRSAELEKELRSVREAKPAVGVYPGENMGTALAASEAELVSLKRQVHNLRAAGRAADTRTQDLEDDKVTAAKSLLAFTRQTKGDINALEKEIVHIKDEACRLEERLEQELAEANHEVDVAFRDTLKTKQELSSQALDNRLGRESLERKLETARTSTQKAGAANADTEQQVEALQRALANAQQGTEDARREGQDGAMATDVRMVTADMERQVELLKLEMADKKRQMGRAQRDLREERMARDAHVANADMKRQLELAEAKHGMEDAQLDLQDEWIAADARAGCGYIKQQVESLKREFAEAKRGTENPQHEQREREMAANAFVAETRTRPFELVGAQSPAVGQSVTRQARPVVSQDEPGAHKLDAQPTECSVLTGIAETTRIGGILHSIRTAERTLTVVRVGKEDEPLLLPKKWPYGVLTVLGGDYGVKLAYDSNACTVRIDGASGPVHDRVVKLLRTALENCAPGLDKDLEFDVREVSGMEGLDSATGWETMVHRSCWAYECVGHLVRRTVAESRRDGTCRHKTALHLRVWGLETAWKQADVALQPRRLAIQRELLGEREAVAVGGLAISEEEAEGYGCELGPVLERLVDGSGDVFRAEVKMSRSALRVLLGTSERSRKLAPQLADVCIEFGWLACKVVIRSKNRDVVQDAAVQYALEAWERFEVVMEVSNNWGGRLDHNLALMRQVSEIVGVPLVVHREIFRKSSTGERTTRTTVRGRAHTEQLANVARAKLYKLSESDQLLEHCQGRGREIRAKHHVVALSKIRGCSGTRPCEEKLVPQDASQHGEVGPPLEKSVSQDATQHGEVGHRGGALRPASNNALSYFFFEMDEASARRVFTANEARAPGHAMSGAGFGGMPCGGRTGGPPADAYGTTNVQPVPSTDGKGEQGDPVPQALYRDGAQAMYTRLQDPSAQGVVQLQCAAQVDLPRLVYEHQQTFVPTNPFPVWQQGERGGARPAGQDSAGTHSS